MKKFIIVVVSVAGLAATGCAATQHPATTVAATASCERIADLEQQVARVYDADRVRHVAPVYRSKFLARAIQPRYIAGAELYLDAEPGVTQPYLQRMLSCHAAGDSAAHPNDPLRAANVEAVNVRVQGHRFVVAVTGADAQAGKQIWQRAEALRTPAARVEVQQLSAATQSATAL